MYRLVHRIVLAIHIGFKPHLSEPHPGPLHHKNGDGEGDYPIINPTASKTGVSRFKITFRPMEGTSAGRSSALRREP